MNLSDFSYSRINLVIQSILCLTILGLIVRDQAHSEVRPPEHQKVLEGPLNRSKSFDGDTFRLVGSDQKIRLWGIDAPETKQTCTRQGEAWACGQASARALSELVGVRSIHCEVKTRDTRYNRLVAVCWVGEIEINEWMVQSGWALAYQSYTKHYLSQERIARDQHLGVWAGSIQNPWDFRRAR